VIDEPHHATAQKEAREKEDDGAQLHRGSIHHFKTMTVTPVTATMLFSRTEQ